MDTRDQLLERLSEIRIALENHDHEDLRARFRLQTARDRLRSALGALDDLEHIWEEWRIQAVRVLAETDLETLGVNIDTRKEPGS